MTAELQKAWGMGLEKGREPGLRKPGHRQPRAASDSLHQGTITALVLRLCSLGQGLKFVFGEQWCVCAKSLQLCLTLCNPMDCSPPGSPVHGILQARILEWVAMPSSRKSSWPRDRTRISYIYLHRQAGSLHYCHQGSLVNSGDGSNCSLWQGQGAFLPLNSHSKGFPKT